MKKICVFTGTRAEYGILSGLIRAVGTDTAFELQLLVTGAHLGLSTGHTLDEIELAGCRQVEKIEILQDSTTDLGVCTAMGLGLMRFAEALSRLQPDLMLVLGDRYEALAAAIACAVCKVPVVHLYGGEKTVGALDDSFRHAISKLSQLHLTSTEVYRQRVIQLGEPPATVFNVGSLGVENIRTLPLPPRHEVANRLQIAEDQPYLLVTFHPATLDREPAAKQVEHVLAALDAYPDHAIIITGANADESGNIINQMMTQFVTARPERTRFFLSLGVRYYLAAVKYADAVVGNSSSGIIEVPSLGVPTVNIGSRQAGRIFADSVIHAAVTTDAIVTAINTALTPAIRASVQKTVNPYEKKAVIDSILQLLKEWDATNVVTKDFYDVAFTLPA